MKDGELAFDPKRKSILVTMSVSLSSSRSIKAETQSTLPLSETSMYAERCMALTQGSSLTLSPIRDVR